MASRNWARMRATGLRTFIDAWKTIEISLRCNDCSSRGESNPRSVPW
jgi:hypothetical protein